MQNSETLKQKKTEMRKSTIIHVLALFLISTLASCASCSSDLKEGGKENGNEEKPDTEEVRPETFASDDEMLDYIQKVHLNWRPNAFSWTGTILRKTRASSPSVAADSVLPVCWWA